MLRKLWYVVIRWLKAHSRLDDKITRKEEEEEKRNDEAVWHGFLVSCKLKALYKEATNIRSWGNRDCSSDGVLHTHHLKNYYE